MMNGTSMNITNANENLKRGKSEETRHRLYRTGFTFSQIHETNRKEAANESMRVVNIDQLDSTMLSPRREDHSPNGFEHNQNIYPSYSIHKDASESPNRRIPSKSKMEVVHTDMLDTDQSELVNGFEMPEMHIPKDRENPEKTESEQNKPINTMIPASRNDKRISPNKDKKAPYSETPLSPVCKLFEIPLEKYKQRIHVEKFFTPFDFTRKNKSNEKKKAQKKELVFNTLRRINNSSPKTNVTKRFDSPLHIQNTTGDETDQDMLRIDSFTYYLNKRTEDKRSNREILRSGQKGSIVYSRKVQDGHSGIQKEDTTDKTKREGDDQYEDEHEFLKQRKLYNYEQ